MFSNLISDVFLLTWLRLLFHRRIFTLADIYLYFYGGRVQCSHVASRHNVSSRSIAGGGRGFAVLTFSEFFRMSMIGMFVLRETYFSIHGPLPKPGPGIVMAVCRRSYFLPNGKSVAIG